MNAVDQEKAAVSINRPLEVGTTTGFVFAKSGSKIVVGSRRETQRDAVVYGTEHRGCKGLFITPAARKANMRTLEERRLTVGDSAPDFILPDTDGNAVRFYSLLRAGHVVIVFHRGSWCPYCDLYLRGFQRHLAKLHELGAQVVAIFPEVAEDFLSTGIKSELALPVLIDEGDKVIRKFGLTVEGNNELLELYRLFGHRLEYAQSHAGKKDVPVAGTFLINSNGIIRLVHADVAHTSRLGVDDIVDAVSELNRDTFLRKKANKKHLYDKAND